MRIHSLCPIRFCRATAHMTATDVARCLHAARHSLLHLPSSNAVPSDGNIAYDDSTEGSCGFSCVLGWTIGLCLFVPCCCALAYFVYRRQHAHSEDQSGWVNQDGTIGRPSNMPYAQPIVYGHGDPRAPLPPSDRFGPAHPQSSYPQPSAIQQPPMPFSGDHWTGTPHKMSESMHQQSAASNIARPSSSTMYPRVDSQTGATRDAYPARAEPQPSAPMAPAIAFPFNYASDANEMGSHTMADPVKESTSQRAPVQRETQQEEGKMRDQPPPPPPYIERA
jgi:hypothetical protein